MVKGPYKHSRLDMIEWLVRPILRSSAPAPVRGPRGLGVQARRGLTRAGKFAAPLPLNWGRMPSAALPLPAPSHGASLPQVIGGLCVIPTYMIVR